MSGGGSPPKAPDYVGAAREQGRQNIEALRIGAMLNRVNQQNPYGSVTYEQDPTNKDRWTQVVNLSPEQQALFDQNQQTQLDLGRIAGLRLGQVGNQGAFTLDGLPSQVTSVQGSNFRTNINSPGVRYTDLDMSSLPGFGNADVQRSVDLSGVSQLPGIDDFSGERQRVEDALYQRSAARLDEQFGQREQQLRTQLMNQGIREGSEAWNRAMRDLDLQRQDAYGDARDRAIAAGGQEQSRLFRDALSGRQQGVSEQFGLGDFANRSAEQINARADAQRAQRLAEILTQGQFGNQAALQQFTNELAGLNLYNDAERDAFSQRMANAQLQNQGRAAGIDERLTEREVPLREFLSLYGGGYQMPFSPGGAANVGSPEPVDYMGAINQQYGAATDMYNYRQARNQQNLNTAANLAMLGWLMFSDRRLKTDIERIGTLPNGIPTYRYRFKGENRQRIGVMSDDVRRIAPEAVRVSEDGYDLVDYGAIGAAHLLGAN